MAKWRASFLVLCSSFLFACQSSEDASNLEAEQDPAPQPAAVAEVETPTRNFILITADTMRGDVASIDGGPAYTPTLGKDARAKLAFSPMLQHLDAHQSVTRIDHDVALFARSRGLRQQQWH